MLFLCVDAGIAVSERLSVSAAQPSQPRHIVVIGDLHMGLGRDPSGAWHPSEDFRWAEEFERFLEVLSDRTAAGTDLILNGDTFELSTPTEMTCSYGDATVGCEEADALQGLNRVLAAHSREVDALAAFSRKRDCLIFFFSTINYSRHLSFSSQGINLTFCFSISNSGLN